MSSTAISIEGLDKAAVLAALYNAARPQGMGFLSYDPKPMSVDEAREMVGGGVTSFDYLKGRVMKVNLSGDSLEPWGYDRDNGAGAAAEAISALRTTNDPNNLHAQVVHQTGKATAAGIVMEHLHSETEVAVSGRTLSMGMGFGDVAHVLEPVVNGIMSEGEPQDFSKLARQEERIKITDSVVEMYYKMSEGNPGAMTVLTRVMDHSDTGFLQILSLDSKKLYGSRIWELFKLCGNDIERFLYHVQMELPDQGTGRLSVTGPYLADMTQEERTEHFAARTFGKPGSFWALENPPVDPCYDYPVGKKKAVPTEPPAPTFGRFWIPEFAPSGGRRPGRSYARLLRRIRRANRRGWMTPAEEARHSYLLCP